MANYFINVVDRNTNQSVEYKYDFVTGVITAVAITKPDADKVSLNRCKSESLAAKDKQLFEFILQHKNGVSIKEVKEACAIRNMNNLATGISKICKQFLNMENEHFDEFKKKYMTYGFFFNFRKGASDDELIYFLHEYHVIGNLVNRTEIREKYENNQISESVITNTELMQLLMKKEPFLSDMLYQTDKGDFLPFIEVKQKIRFPLIVNMESSSVSHEINDSFKEQREGLGARMYDGSNFRALNIQKDKLTVGKSSYFVILDSADYVASRLKVYHHQNNEKEFNRVLAMWSERILNIRNNFDFSLYNSGIAFSIPIFEVSSEGKLKVLAAKGSQFKATGSGKRHIAPAGMLEVFSHERYGEFDFEQFKTLYAKELLEETVFGQENASLDETNDFFGVLYPFFEAVELRKQNVTFTSLKENLQIILSNWKEIWTSLGKKEDIPNYAALSALLNMTEIDFYQNSFFIVDFANLRPEFILPIYINEPINEIVNWEYEQGNNDECLKKDILSFNNLDDLNKWARIEVNEYCAPALAAIYLGAKYFFNKNKESL